MDSGRYYSLALTFAVSHPFPEDGKTDFFEFKVNMFLVLLTAPESAIYHLLAMDKPPIPSAEALQSLVERFAHARWIQRAMVSPEPFTIEFTELGKRRILQVVAFLDEANSKNFPEPSDLKATDKGREIISQLEQVLEDLTPPKLTISERHTLFGLSLSFRQKFP